MKTLSAYKSLLQLYPHFLKSYFIALSGLKLSDLLACLCLLSGGLKSCTTMSSPLGPFRVKVELNLSRNIGDFSKQSSTTVRI